MINTEKGTYTQGALVIARTVTTQGVKADAAKGVTAVTQVDSVKVSTKPLEKAVTINYSGGTNTPSVIRFGAD